MNVAYCHLSTAPVRAEKKDASEMVTQILFGEPLLILEESGSWIQIESLIDGYKGFVDIKQIRCCKKKEIDTWMNELSILSNQTLTLGTPWGMQELLKGAFIPRATVASFQIGNDEFNFLQLPQPFPWKSLSETAICYLNTPYLWGGKTPFGIDCSGFTQTVFRFFDIPIPRDASQQVACGKEIPFTEIEPGDLAFFINQNKKIIHVGICMDNHNIIHASGKVRIDILTPKGISHSESGELTHTLHSIRRVARMQ